MRERSGHHQRRACARCRGNQGTTLMISAHAATVFSKVPGKILFQYVDNYPFLTGGRGLFEDKLWELHSWGSMQPHRKSVDVLFCHHWVFPLCCCSQTGWMVPCYMKVKNKRKTTFSKTAPKQSKKSTNSCIFMGCGNLGLTLYLHTSVPEYSQCVCTMTGMCGVQSVQCAECVVQSARVHTVQIVECKL